MAYAVLELTNITSNSVQVNISSSIKDSAYIIKLNWAEVKRYEGNDHAVNFSYTISNLAPLTNYSVQVYEGWSNEHLIKDFTTNQEDPGGGGTTPPPEELTTFPIVIYTPDTNVSYIQIQSLKSSGAPGEHNEILIPTGNQNGIYYNLPYDELFYCAAYSKRGYKPSQWNIRYYYLNGSEYAFKNGNFEITSSPGSILASNLSLMALRPEAGELKNNCQFTIYCKHIGVQSVNIKIPEAGIVYNHSYKQNDSGYNFFLYEDETIEFTATLNPNQNFNLIQWDIQKFDLYGNLKEEILNQPQVNIVLNDIITYAQIKITPKAVLQQDGSVYIYYNNSWKQATPYIYYNNSWNQVIPYIYVQIGTDNLGNPIYDWAQCK